MLSVGGTPWRGIPPIFVHRCRRCNTWGVYSADWGNSPTKVRWVPSRAQFESQKLVLLQTRRHECPRSSRDYVHREPCKRAAEREPCNENRATRTVQTCGFKLYAMSVPEVLATTIRILPMFYLFSATMGTPEYGPAPSGTTHRHPIGTPSAPHWHPIQPPKPLPFYGGGPKINENAPCLFMGGPKTRKMPPAFLWGEPPSQLPRTHHLHYLLPFFKSPPPKKAASQD